MDLQVIRAIECIYRHSHIFTHGARYSESLNAVQFAEETAWLPPDTHEVYSWDDVPQLANDYLHAILSWQSYVCLLITFNSR